jgi:hypothetical protein
MLKNVALSAEDRLIAQARRRARLESLSQVAGSEFEPAPDKFQAGHCQG